jgi:hypothetical protein
VPVNGTELARTGLVARAQAPQQALAGLNIKIPDAAQAPGQIAVAFLVRGRHTGPSASPVATIDPTHRDTQVPATDVLALTAEEVIPAIWAVPGELGLLHPPGKIKLA